MPQIARIFPLFAIGAVVAACSSAAQPTEEPAAATEEAVSTCVPTLGCCVGSPLAFDQTDSFQKQLAAWGCKPPKMYNPASSPGAYWFSSVCPDPNKQVETFLSANTKYLAAPYSAVVNPTVVTACIPHASTGSVNVLWDPTCSTCKTY